GDSMTMWRTYCLATALILGTCWPIQAQSGSPETALEELATANSPEAVLRHLPVAVGEYVNKLPAQAKAAMLDKMVISKMMESEGKTLRRSGDGSGWEVAGADGKIEGTFRVRGTFTSGVDALVPLEIQRGRDSLTVLIGLRLEDGAWRITE